MMTRCRCGKGGFTVRFERSERDVLDSLLDLLRQACNDDWLGAPIAGPATPGAWSAEERLAVFLDQFGTPPPTRVEAPSEPGDPAVRRLFPDACPTDPAVSADFRRLTLADQRMAKLEAADAVRSGLAGASPRGEVRIAPASLDDWLVTMTSLRLILATRLGIAEEADEDAYDDLAGDDPRAWTYSVYVWLAWLEEAVLDCLANLADWS